ncbi:hypothetical protein BDZ94DRAFT_1266551 [Collybia nuda]|uniref:Uncharacterized protein n=1 Tax=Collybia nuda TaxID=64659 RepID=A0A9P5Y0T5_9AGAR|nr:hypothetical protein BDZ94DRAFT_1266551 [Collybia nuda]
MMACYWLHRKILKEVFTLSHITRADSARTHRLHTDLFGRRLCQLLVRVRAESASVRANPCGHTD